MKDFKHKSVLLNESINNLNIKEDGIYVDCTLGGGGHTYEILKRINTGHVYSFDQDKMSIDYNKQNLKNFLVSDKLTLIQDNFRNIYRDLMNYRCSKVDGILYDLGVSSPQLDLSNRGFSYRRKSPLDMRMDTSQDLTAEKIVNDWSLNDLVNIFQKYGEEKFSYSIAKRIVNIRKSHRISDTEELSEIIKSSVPEKIRKKSHPAKKVFQALRIVVNDELNSLSRSLTDALTMLNLHGRICCITFQPLEDQIVQKIFKKNSRVNVPRDLPIVPKQLQPKYKMITKKAISPSENELNDNHRAHSAKLRVIEKVLESTNGTKYNTPV